MSDPLLFRPLDATLVQMQAALMASGVARLGEEFADAFPAALLARVPCDVAGFLAMSDELATGPQMVVHNDCLLDNLFFADDGTPMFVDWQTVAVARGSQDVAMLLGGSLEPADLSSHWESLLSRYHARLCAAGVSDYGLDELLVLARRGRPLRLLTRGGGGEGL